MHGKNIVHRDINSTNIIVGNKLNLMMVDFGNATNQKIDQLFESGIKGTRLQRLP